MGGGALPSPPPPVSPTLPNNQSNNSLLSKGSTDSVIGNVSVKEKTSNDRCSIVVHFDHNTRKLWKDLHNPYGNYSSFFRHLLLLERYWRNGDLELSENAKEKSSIYLRSVRNRIDAYECNHKRSEAELSDITRPNLSVPALPTLLHTLESTSEILSGNMQKSPILGSPSTISDASKTSQCSAKYSRFHGARVEGQASGLRDNHVARERCLPLAFLFPHHLTLLVCARFSHGLLIVVCVPAGAPQL